MIEVYKQDRDGNANPITEAIERTYTLEIDVTTTLTDIALTIPEGCYGFGVVHVPDGVNVRLSINDYDYVTTKEGFNISPYLFLIGSVKIKTTGTSSTEKVELLFLK